MSKTIDRNNLNDFMEMDHVIEVHADGTVTDGPTVWAPEVWTSNADQLNPQVDSMPSSHWELITGYSGQEGYSGPIMHPSEYIGGGMANMILSTPGVYVAVEVRDIDADRDAGEDDSVGWALLRLITVPVDYPVKVLADDDPAIDRMTCGTCGRAWDDAIVTGMTPVPAGRCPFEYYHGSD